MNRWLCAGLIALGIQHPTGAATNRERSDSTLPEAIAQYLTMDNRDARELYLSNYAMRAAEAIYQRVREGFAQERDFWREMVARNPAEPTYHTNYDFYNRALAENISLEELMRLYPVEPQTLREAKDLLMVATSDWRLMMTTLEHYGIPLSPELTTKLQQRFAWYGLQKDDKPAVPSDEIARLASLYQAKRDVSLKRYPEALKHLDQVFAKGLYEDAVAIARDLPQQLYVHCEALQAKGETKAAYLQLSSLDSYLNVGPYLERNRSWEAQTMRRLRIAEGRKHFRWSKKIWTAIEKGEIFKGMTREQVKVAWGDPIPGKAVSFPPDCEQWVYAPGSFLLFEKGILTLYRI